MPKVGDKYKYKVKYVKPFYTKKGTAATSFSITEKINSVASVELQDFSFAVWDVLDLSDGDFVTILTIDSIEVKKATNKQGKLATYFNLTGTVKIIKNVLQQCAEEQAPAFVPPPVDAGTNDPVDSNEWILPFDI